MHHGIQYYTISKNFTGYALSNNNKKKHNLILTMDGGTVILFAPA